MIGIAGVLISLSAPGGGEGRGERLSHLSSGAGEVTPDIACFGVEPDEEFASKSGTDHLFGLAGLGESAMACDEIGLIPAYHLGDDEQDGADLAATAAHRALAIELTAVAGDWGEAAEFAGGLVRQGADLGHFGHDPRHRAIGNALDLAKGGVELLPERVAIDQL